jgi:hypothetical protein
VAKWRAGAFLVMNELHISENLLRELEKGIIDEKEVEATLAHEFGHFIAYNQKSRLEKLKHLFTFRARARASANPSDRLDPKRAMNKRLSARRLSIYNFLS